MDEGPLTFDVTSKRTVDSKGIKSVVINAKSAKKSPQCSFSLLRGRKKTTAHDNLREENITKR